MYKDATLMQTVSLNKSTLIIEEEEEEEKVNSTNSKWNKK